MIEVDEKYLFVGDSLRDCGRIARKTVIVCFAVIGVVLLHDYYYKSSAPEFRAAEKSYHDRCYESRVGSDGKYVPPRLKDECL